MRNSIFSAVTLLFSFILVAPSFGQNCGSIVKHINLDGDEAVWGSAVSKDSAVYICGSVNRTSTEGAFIIKTDNKGTVLWTRVIPGTGTQVFRKVIVTTDSGCLTVGASSTYPASPSFAAIVVKWDKNGNKQWARSFNSNSDFGDVASGALQCKDGSFIISGVQNVRGYKSSGLLIKLDNTGNFQWSQKYTYFEGLDFVGIVEEEDGFVVAGDYLYAAQSIYRGLIAKVNKTNGSLIKLKSWTVDGKPFAYGVLSKRANGGYYWGGLQLTVQGHSEMKHIMLYLDANFAVEKAVKINFAVDKYDAYTEFDIMPDGSFVGGMGGERATDDADMYRVAENGSLSWAIKLGGDGAQQLQTVSYLANDNIIGAGYTNNGGTGTDILWIRTNTTKSPSSCNFLPSDASVTVPVVTEVSFQFDSFVPYQSSAWVSINPAIESDGFESTYTCSLEECVIVPLTLKSLQGSYINNTYSQLSFVTSNEINMSSYAIERSYDGRTFTKVGSLAAKGLITDNNYTYQDFGVSGKEAKVYYRLKMYDKDGGYKYSSTIILTINTKAAGFALFPNPSTGFLQLQFFANASGKSIITIVNALGKQVYQQQMEILKGNNSIAISNLPSLPKGLYYVYFTANEQAASQKLILQ